MTHSLQFLQGLRILHVTNRVSRESWLEKVLLEVPELKLQFREVQGSFDGMKALQTQAFDFILVSIRPVEQSLDFIDGCRTGGVTAPMMILGRKKDSNLLTQCCERGGNGVISLEGTTVSDLLWKILLAVREHRNSEQNIELRGRLQQEALRKSKENEVFIERQRKMLAESAAPTLNGLTPYLENQYLELLKNCIPMTLENYADLAAPFVRELLAKKITAAELFTMHLNALETILRSPGRKSPHHLMNRASLLLNRLTISLLNHYQQSEISHSPATPLAFDFSDIATDCDLL